MELPLISLLKDKWIFPITRFSNTHIIYGPVGNDLVLEINKVWSTSNWSNKVIGVKKGYMQKPKKL